VCFALAHQTTKEGVSTMSSNCGVVKKYVLALTAVLLVFATLGWAGDEKDDSKADSDIVKRMDKAADVLKEIEGAPDNGIPDNIMGDAKCIAVIPSMVKVAIGFGGSHGKGVATCRTASGWSAPAPITVTGGSWGLQLGGQAVDLVMLVMNDKGMEHLLSSKFKVGADASAAAGPVGRHASADTDWKMKSEILTYSRSRGLFAGIDLSGTAVTQDKDETRILYGKMVPFADILTGKVSPPKESRTFLAAVEKYAPPSPQQGKVERPESK
jgi:lipid-binding SYLF domain-containing protein